jgi:hypothetical protein
LDSWAGRTRQKVRVVGETPKRVRILALSDLNLPGRRHIKAGETALVPKYAITKEEGK